MLLGVGQLRQLALELADKVHRQLERQQVGIGEIAVVVRFFLGAHGARLALAGVEQPRLLVDLAAGFEDVDLPARLDLDRLADEADGVDVLDLAARAELGAGLPDRDVDVGAQVALLHVGVGGAEIAQDGAQLGHVRLRLLGGAHVGTRHDLHQRDARAVEVDVGIVGVLVVDRLAGVLLQMQALDADLHRLAVDVDLDLALADDRLLVLADLIALRQVGVEVVLAVEHASEVDRRLEAEPGAHGLRDALGVDHRQHAGHRRVDQRDMAVGLGAELGGSAGEQLGARSDLRVHLEADDDLPLASGALDQVLGVGGLAEAGLRAVSCMGVLLRAPSLSQGALRGKPCWLV